MYGTKRGREDWLVDWLVAQHIDVCVPSRISVGVAHESGISSECGLVCGQQNKSVVRGSIFPVANRFGDIKLDET
jgi:hypothetical protein